MNTYYIGRRAQHYNVRWRGYTRRTLTQALAMIDIEALRDVGTQQGRPPRILDVACGTGILLKQILARMPDAQAHGVDASADMLRQARAALAGRANVRLEQAKVGVGPTANLPYEPGTFDLITFTNALHYLPDPVGALDGLRLLLTPGGQLVVEDFAPREPALLWAAFERLIRWVDTGEVRAYTLGEARSLCALAGLQIVREKAFPIDWLWRGWALRGR